MGRSVNQKQCHVFCMGCFAKCLICHVFCSSLASCHHEQRLVDQFNLVCSIPGHKIHQAASGVQKSGVGMCMGSVIVFISFTIQIGCSFGGVFTCDARHT